MQQGNAARQCSKAMQQGNAPPGGQRNARLLLSLAQLHRVDMPLTQGLVAIYDGAQPMDVLTALMSREARGEAR